MSMLMKALLKALGIGREVGTEDEAQALWLETLGALGYKSQQAFPDNMTKGTDRLLGDPTIGRTTSVVDHVFKPRFITKTYYDLETGVPLYSRTKGVLGNPELVLWAGIVGMRDVLGNRFPKSDDDKRTDIYREGHPALGGKKQQPVMIEASKILSREGQPFTGEKPDELPSFDSLDEQEEWLETNYPEYHKWLVENLHMPIEAQGNLDKLGVSKDRADLLRLVDEITPKNLIDTVFDDAVKEDNDKYQIVLIANDGVKSKVTDRGFVRIFSDDYYRTLMDSDEISDYVKLALEKINSDEGRVIGAKSEYFIRLPQGAKLKSKVAKWLNELKVGKTMFDNEKKDSEWRNIIKNEGKKGADEQATISQRSKGSMYQDDWEVEGELDRFTALPKDAAKVVREKGVASEDTNCCLLVKDNIQDYIRFENPRIHQVFGTDRVRQIISEQLTCPDIEEMFVDEGRRTGEVKNQQGTILYRGRLPQKDIVIDFEDQMTPKGKPYKAGGTAKVTIDIHRPAPFMMHAGKGSLTPKMAYTLMDFEYDTRGYGDRDTPARQKPGSGMSYSLVDIYLICKTGEIQVPGSKKIRLRTGDESENLSYYEDVGMDMKVSQKTKDMIISTWVRSYGGNPISLQRGQLSPAELAKMKKEWPDGHAMYRGEKQVSDTGKVTVREMNLNERMRESFWDDEDELSRFLHEKKMKEKYPNRPDMWGKAPRVDRGHSDMSRSPDKKLSLEEREKRGWGLKDYDVATRKRMTIWTKIPDAGEDTTFYDSLLDMLDSLDANALVGIKDISELDTKDPIQEKISEMTTFPVLQHGSQLITTDIGKYIKDRL